jgi:hypothetical protein
MKMSEKVRRWYPIEGIGERYWLESVSDTIKELRFIFHKDTRKNTKVHISSEFGVYSYKITNESLKLEPFVYLDNPEDIDRDIVWCFYIVENSSYLRLMSKESGTVSEAYGLKHYCIMTENDIIDIISTCVPIVELYQDEKLIRTSRAC